MTDTFDDTRSWDEPAEVRTGQMARVPGRRGSFERTRSHRVVRRDDPLPPAMAMAFDDFAPHEDDPWGDVEHVVEPVEERGRPFVGVDPRLMRIGAVALAGVLMIPLALALREDADGGLRSETLAATDSTVATTVADASTTTALTVPVTAAAIAPVAAATRGTAAATAPPTASRAPAAQAVAVAEPVCAGRYTVIFNDYWNRFPKTSGASVEEWLEANHATPDSPLYVGDELCIPPGAQAPAPPPPPTTEAPAATAAPTTQAAAPTQAPATMAAPVGTPAPTAASVVTQPPAPTATPTPTPTPAPSPPIPVDRAGAETIIREVWPDELEERALTIARRESSLRPEVYNGTCCYGLFQIHFQANRAFLATLGITSADQLRDARTNATAAYAMYQQSGWTPWRTTDPG